MFSFRRCQESLFFLLFDRFCALVPRFTLMLFPSFFFLIRTRFSTQRWLWRLNLLICIDLYAFGENAKFNNVFFKSQIVLQKHQAWKKNSCGKLPYIPSKVDHYYIKVVKKVATRVPKNIVRMMFLSMQIFESPTDEFKALRVGWFAPPSFSNFISLRINLWDLVLKKSIINFHSSNVRRLTAIMPGWMTG